MRSDTRHLASTAMGAAAASAAAALPSVSTESLSLSWSALTLWVRVCETDRVDWVRLRDRLDSGPSRAGSALAVAHARVPAQHEGQDTKKAAAAAPLPRCC